MRLWKMFKKNVIKELEEKNPMIHFHPVRFDERLFSEDEKKLNEKLQSGWSLVNDYQTEWGIIYQMVRHTPLNRFRMMMGAGFFFSSLLVLATVIAL